MSHPQGSRGPGERRRHDIATSSAYLESHTSDEDSAGRPWPCRSSNRSPLPERGTDRRRGPPPVPPKALPLRSDRPSEEHGQSRDSSPNESHDSLSEECCNRPDKGVIWNCLQCGCSFCDRCWNQQRQHKKGTVGADGRPHEKVDYRTFVRLRNTFQESSNARLEQQHEADDRTTWFGIEKQIETTYWHHTDRLMEILQDQDEAVERTERFPQLVSFVGQTGAGKSTVIKMLIEREQQRRQDDVQLNVLCPVTGNVADNVPTTGNVHLYEDPGTSMTSPCPILYADSEGMTGGEKLPKGLALRERYHQRKRPIISKKTLRKVCYKASQYSKPREKVVADLFPRILYTFSDVIVFTLKEVRTFEHVLGQLIDWAAVSTHRSLNQPMMPHVVIILNASDPSLDDKEWDPLYSTRKLLNDYEDSVIRGLREKVEIFGPDNRPKTTEQLLRRFSSSVTVIRIPSKLRLMQVDTQVGKLYDIIRDKCSQSHSFKRKIRMALNAEKLLQYVRLAHIHFSVRPEDPFDFIAAAQRLAQAPDGFRGHILNLILACAASQQNSAENIYAVLELLAPLIASCILLAATADKAPGLYSNLLDRVYREHLESALHELSEQWLQCEYDHKGVRCRNVQNAHGKGHQGPSGRMLGGPGPSAYKSNFEPYTFCRRWISEIAREVRKLEDEVRSGFGMETNIVNTLHGQVVAESYSQPQLQKFLRSQSHQTCLYCVRTIPEIVLSCRHNLCRVCLMLVGSHQGDGVVEIDHCPFLPGQHRLSPPDKIRFKPTNAGVRVLSLDGGGARGLVELRSLQAIERHLGGIPIRCFFDLIVGTSTGGIMSLGLGVHQWTVEECIRKFKELSKDAFTKRPVEKLAYISHQSTCKTKPLEAALKGAFSESRPLFGQSVAEGVESIRVAVTASSVDNGKPVIFANYNREDISGNVAYDFVRPRDPQQEVKVWEAARATSAAPPYFKPFMKEGSLKTYQDGGLNHNCPVKVADLERRLIWPEVSQWPADILLSLGTGLSAPSIREHPPPTDQERRKIRRNRILGIFDPMISAAKDIIGNQLDCQMTWNQYCDSITGFSAEETSEKLHRNVRVDVTFPGKRPNLDAVDGRDFADMDKVCEESLAKDPAIIEVAHRLVASCFYFEPLQCTHDKARGDYVCFGSIKCRLPEGQMEIRRLGQLLQSFSLADTFAPHFVLECNYGTSYVRSSDLAIEEEVIHGMCRRGKFRCPSERLWEIRGSSQSSRVRVSLRLRAENYRSRPVFSKGYWVPSSVDSALPISGFPRELFQRLDTAKVNEPAEDASEEEERDIEKEELRLREGEPSTDPVRPPAIQVSSAPPQIPPKIPPKDSTIHRINSNLNPFRNPRQKRSTSSFASFSDSSLPEHSNSPRRSSEDIGVRRSYY